MCAPVVLALQIAAAAYGVYAQRKAAKKQEKAIREQQQVQEEQITAQKGQEMQQRVRTAMAERARLRAMSAESGLAGISMNDIVNNVDFGMGQDLATIQQNGGNAVRASRADATTSMSRIQQPDYIGAALSIATSVSGYNQSKPTGG